MDIMSLHYIDIIGDLWQISILETKDAVDRN